MQKIIRLTSIVILLCFISYSLLVCFNQNTAKAVSQSISSNIDEIDESIYPGIKERIKKLQEKYPNWKFELLYTDLEWNEVINAEYSGHGISPKNLVEYTSGFRGQWICSICKEEHKYDNGNWRCASIEAIQYKMDPRNILNETDIFQLEELSNKGYTIDELKLITNNTYLSGQEQSIINVANNCNINSFYLAARLIQEQGANPTSPLALGTGYKGQYVGYYNVFNIKASGSTNEEVILNGLSHAKQKGWDTLEKSIQAGINFLATNYISKGQNTLYLQKFDVEITNGLYSNQYMQNLTAPTTEAATLRKAYSNTNSIDSTHIFLIPVYKNMPNEVCNKPDVNGKSKYKDYSIFRVNANPTLFLRDKPAGKIIESQTLNGGELVTLLEKATMKVNGTYWDKVQRYNGAIGYAARETSENELPNYKLYLVPVFIEEIPEEDNNNNNQEDNSNGNNTPEDNNNNNNNNNNNENNTPGDNDNNNAEDTSKEPIIVETKNGKYKIENDTIILEPNVVLENIKEKYLDATSDSQSLGTGKKVTINSKSYTIIKLGDVSGDGEIKSKDYMMIKNCIMKTLELNDIEKIAADVSNDNEIKSKDYMMIKNHIMKISSITL